MNESYEFDPCSLEESEEIESLDSSINLPITLDNWKASPKKTIVPKSEWRQKQNDGNHNQDPGIDELKKINMYIKRKFPDYQIMDAFGINCETLVAIKRGCYGPVSGISLDNQSKIYREFNRLEKKMEQFMEAFKFLADNFIDDKNREKRIIFLKIIEKPNKIKKEQDIDDEMD